MESFDYYITTIPDSRWWRVRSTIVYRLRQLRDKIRKPRPYRIGQ